MKIILPIVVTLLVGSATILCSESTTVDSLKRVVALDAADTNTINALIELSNVARVSDPTIAVEYAQQAVHRAKALGFHRGHAYALKSIGLVQFARGEYVGALQTFKQSLKIFEEHGIKVGVANMLNNIGVIYFNRGLEEQALDHYLRSLKVSEQLNDTLRIATALINLGTIYSNKPASYAKALDYYRRTLPLGRKLNDNEILGTSIANIGEMYYRWGKYDSALVYLEEAVELTAGTVHVPFALNVIGNVYYKLGDYQKALTYQRMSFDSAKKLNEAVEMAQSLLSIAETQVALHAIPDAIDAYKQAEVYFNGPGMEATYDAEKVYKGLTAIYTNLGDYQNASLYQSKHLSLKEKIYNLEVDKKLATALFEYEIEKKQLEIDTQQKEIGEQNLLLNVFIGGFVVVLLFAGVFLAQRIRIQKEKRRSDELLLNILPAETADELRTTGEARAKSYESVSVLFTDFKDFTKASETLSPEELVMEINTCYSEFDRIITRHGLEKIKTIGDAYMCAGGLPAVNDTHAVDAVAAALEIATFMRDHSLQRKAENKPYFELRLGIHTGPVVAGVVGIKKFAYDIWGDTVNTALRMEESGEVGRLNISGSTYKLVSDRFKCEHRGKVEAKNKGFIDMYFVERRV